MSGDDLFIGLVQWRAEAERLREIVMGAHAIRCMCGDVITGGDYLGGARRDPRCREIQALAAPELGGTRQVPRAIRFYGDEP